MPTQGLESWSRKVTAIPQAIKDAQKQVNNTNAIDFMQQVAARVPKDGEKEGERATHLVNTLAKENFGEMGVRVSIGGPEAPYPAHLEWGHLVRGRGAHSWFHVGAKPFWFPLLRVNRRRFKNRVSRAVRAAILGVVRG